eukprot:6461806-Amphidinium_carterae.1
MELRSHVSMLLLQIIGGILIVNHVLACVWFTVGDRWGEHLRPRSWLEIVSTTLLDRTSSAALFGRTLQTRI